MSPTPSSSSALTIPEVVTSAVNVVEVRNASKSYALRSSDNAAKVLNGFNMKVPRGAIYSLLGSSGCGKTTVLSCVVGLRKLDTGIVTVFGHKPGTPQSGVPGSRVGYMPQDLCLYDYLTLTETLKYFAQIYGMDDKAIMEATDFIVKLLNLDGLDNLVATFSGGQKRRVSFAIALIHKPQLLILDEPTVGVDPVLRERIWNYLRKLSDTQETTVIITTHYIEEARQSHMIGLMGKGKLLYENSPEALLRQTSARLLVDAVFQVYQRHENENEKSLEDSSANTEESTCNIARTTSMTKDLSELKDVSTSTSNLPGSMKTIGSLLRRNLAQMTRNLWYLFFILALPAVHVLAAVVSLGANPHSIKLGVVDHEWEFNGNRSYERINNVELTACVNSTYSCRYLSLIPEHDVHLYSYGSEEEAIEGVKDSSISAYLTFHANFTQYFQDRVLTNNFADNETLDGSEIRLRKDMTDIQVGLRLEEVLGLVLQDFLVKILDEPELGMIPLNFSNPVYGSVNVSHQSYVAAGTIVLLSTLYPMCTIAMHIIADKNRGTMERTLVAGVTKMHVLIGEILTHALFLFIQTGFMYLIVVTISEITVQGSFLLSVMLSYVNGFLGVSFGFLLPLFCKKEVEALLLANGFILPDMIISGLAWPIQFMPKWLQYCGYFFPHTFPGVAMRAILNRGWTLAHPQVWMGFLSSFIWILLTWILILKFNVLTR